eukprot:474501-Pleurochrysis_carterae.AAC.1
MVEESCDMYFARMCELLIADCCVQCESGVHLPQYLVQELEEQASSYKTARHRYRKCLQLLHREVLKVAGNDKEAAFSLLDGVLDALAQRTANVNRSSHEQLKVFRECQSKCIGTLMIQKEHLDSLQHTSQQLEKYIDSAARIRLTPKKESEFK